MGGMFWREKKERKVSSIIVDKLRRVVGDKVQICLNPEINFLSLTPPRFIDYIISCFIYIFFFNLRV